MLPPRADDALLKGRLVVLSPHLDDAALSVGATIARAARLGADVTIVTVLAGDPDSTVPAASWDTECGFATAGEAARSRREEDRRACEVLGARPVWLPFCDEEYDRGATDEVIWTRLRPLIELADRVFVPGYPLINDDHAWLSRLVLSRVPATCPVTLYVEQPYANLLALERGYRRSSLGAMARFAVRASSARTRVMPHVPTPLDDVVQRPVLWLRSPGGFGGRAAKRAAISAYSSQVRALGRRLLARIRLYERAWGGEGLGLPGAEPPPAY